MMHLSQDDFYSIQNQLRKEQESLMRQLIGNDSSEVWSNKKPKILKVEQTRCEAKTESQIKNFESPDVKVKTSVFHVDCLPEKENRLFKANPVPRRNLMKGNIINIF